MAERSTRVAAAGMARLPAPHLRRYLGWYHGYRIVGPPGRHRGLPSPFLTLIITLDAPLVLAAHPDPKQSPGSFDTLIGGLHARPATVVHAGVQAGVQVALNPLGARELLGLPAAELAHLDAALDDVAGPWARSLHEQLTAAATWAARFDLLDEAFTARLAAVERLRRPVPAPELRRAWQALVHEDQEVSVGGLAADLGWSPRRLLGRFRDELGVTPSQAARIARFDRARRRLFERACAGEPLQLAELAAGCGYYDQAHLAREFREFAGCAPSRLVAEELRFVQAPELPAPAG